ncbi:Copia protein, partial [Cyphomyrmex costatus]
LMIQSGLPPFLWAEAVNTANYIKNRCITRSLNDESPYKKWHNKKPNIGYFATFGEKVYVLDKSPNKGKMDPRGIPGIFVGYFEISKGFKIWIPNSKKIVITRDIKFLREIQKTSNGEDIICNETKNGRFMLRDDENHQRETIIGPNHSSEHETSDNLLDNDDQSEAQSMTLKMRAATRTMSK